MTSLSMPYPQQRIFNLARRLGVTVSEAAQMCARKGARMRRQKARQCACLDEDEKYRRIMAERWDLREDRQQ